MNSNFNKYPLVRLGEVCDFQYGISKKLYKEGLIPVIRMNNINNTRVNLKPLMYLKEEFNSMEKFVLKNNDIVLNRTNSLDNLGKVGIIDNIKTCICFSSYLVRIVLKFNLIPQYLNYLMNTMYFQQTLKNISTPSVSQSNVNVSRISNIKIPLPPLDIQQRIVEKLDRQYELVKQAQNFIDNYKVVL